MARNKKPDEYSPLAENLSKEKRKRDVGFEVVGKRLRLKYWKLIYDKTCEDEEDELKEGKGRPFQLRRKRRTPKMLKRGEGWPFQYKRRRRMRRIREEMEMERIRERKVKRRRGNSGGRGRGD